MTSVQDLIRKKRDGKTLANEEIKTFIDAVTNKKIQDCQTGAMLMAIWQKGMVPEEVETLTREMMSSGEVMSWPKEWAGLVVDKHSTGGVGDKVSLVLAPALAACGCKVPMISGRGLAHTGGTLDKLESIPGFNIHQSAAQILEILGSIDPVRPGETPPQQPSTACLLITASIVSKKGAESLSALVLDVKFGRAALYKDLDSARELAQSLVHAGNLLGMRTAAVMESLETLKGRGPEDLMELVTTLGGMLLQMTGSVSDLSEGRRKISDAVIGGAALSKFQAMMEAQGSASWLRLHFETSASDCRSDRSPAGGADCRIKHSHTHSHTHFSEGTTAASVTLYLILKH
ncbi:hypothetical protein KUCAC02_035682 [Chaenocephalus aceratus]|nr:hypothetical protein KUCAC02_035682 [Chaenocephalus aceratus]